MPALHTRCLHYIFVDHISLEVKVTTFTELYDPGVLRIEFKIGSTEYPLWLVVYRKTQLLNIDLLLDPGYNYMNRNVPRELVDFIYHKISKVVSILLMPLGRRWKINNAVVDSLPRQLNLKFNYKKRKMTNFY